MTAMAMTSMAMTSTAMTSTATTSTVSINLAMSHLCNAAALQQPPNQGACMAATPAPQAPSCLCLPCGLTFLASSVLGVHLALTPCCLCPLATLVALRL